MQRAFTFAMLLFVIASISNAAAQAPAVRHNTWTSGTPLPVPVQFTQTGVINGLIYVVGGFNSNGIVGNNQIYNPATNTWSSGAPMPDPTGYGTSAVVKNILYVIGGTSQSANQETGAVWAYDPTTDTWTEKSPMPTARGGTGTAVEKNIIYVIGGNGNDESRLTNVEAYNPAKDKWTEKAPLLIGRSEPSVGLLKASIGGKVVQTIVAADGFTPSGDTGDTDGYDVSTNTWTSLTPDPLTRNEACTGAIGGNLYVAAGSEYGSGSSTENDVYNLATNGWTTLASSPQSVSDPGSAVYKNTLYCFGGGNNTGGGDTVYNYVQIYHP